MAQIGFVHEGCNGWAAYDNLCIKGDNPKNVHVVEVVISLDPFGHEIIKPNEKRETCCGKYTLKPGQWTPLAKSKDANDMRYKLADLQKRHEVCGKCVAHFYADQD